MAKTIHQTIREAQRTHATCMYCGIKLLRFRNKTVDHIVPLIRGGQNKEDNMVLVCKPCNLGKGQQPLAVFLAQSGLEVSQELKHFLQKHKKQKDLKRLEAEIAKQWNRNELYELLDAKTILLF